tara:strand:- start:1611 stop:1751 length:141 start_codon:yes stop_codon:yes gene_type:complete
MKKIKESEVKLHLDKGKIYVEYACVMDIIARHDKLIDQIKERSSDA